MEIKAIETRYKGYRFRSRMEAKWAYFFDLCGIGWEYEPEGYELSGGVRYLPDFYLKLGNNREVFAEVKKPGGDLSKPRQFCQDSGKSILILEGNPELKRYWEFHALAGEDGFDVYETDEELFFCPAFIDGEVRIFLQEAPYDPWWDNSIPFARRAYLAYLLMGPEAQQMDVNLLQKGYDMIETAVRKAQSARFEFGESPSISG